MKNILRQGGYKPLRLGEKLDLRTPPQYSMDPDEPTTPLIQHPAEGPEQPSGNQSMPPHTRWVGHAKFAFCLLLHAILVACHLLLVIVGHNGHPLHLVHNHWYTKGFFTSINFGPNFLGKAYLVLLLWYTQKLALRRNLHKKQSLTAIHDQATAWLGLGSAIPVIWDQFSTCVSPLYVACIFLYLAGLFLLGITMPMLLSIGAVYDHEARYLNITSYLADAGTSAAKMTAASPAVNLLPLAGWDISTLGWQGNMIYDIPNFLARRAVHVSATQVQVRCFDIPNATQTAFNDTSGTYFFQIDPRVEDVEIAPTNRAIYVLPLIMKNTTNSASAPAAPSTMIIASTMPIQDDDESRRSSVTNFSPAVTPQTCQFPHSDCATFASLQLLACDTNFYEQYVAAIPQVGLLGNETGAPVKNGWSNWTLPAPPRDIALSMVNQFGQFSPQSNTVQKYQPVGRNSSGNYTFSMLETNIMDTLRFDHEDNDQINLGELEMALQSAVAAVFWRASVRIALEVQLPFSGPAQSSQAHGAPFRYSVQITFWPPIVGLAMSVVMFVLAVLLTRHAQPASHEHAELETTGVLQLTWLLYNAKCADCELKIVERIRKDNTGPKIKDLRKQGHKIEVAGWSDKPEPPRDGSDQS